MMSSKTYLFIYRQKLQLRYNSKFLIAVNILSFHDPKLPLCFVNHFMRDVGVSGLHEFLDKTRGGFNSRTFHHKIKNPEKIQGFN